MKSKQPQPERISEKRGGKLHITRISDGKVYCVICHKYQTIEQGNCCPACLKMLNAPLSTVQLPLAHEGVPNYHLRDIYTRGMVRARKL